MAINSKQKGARFERQLAAKFREYGYKDSRRTAQYCGNTGDAADIVGLPHLHIEAKHVERLNIYDAMEQAKRDAAAGAVTSDECKLPVVIHKKNNHETLVTMRFDDFMTIYKSYETGMLLQERE